MKNTVLLLFLTLSTPVFSGAMPSFPDTLPAEIERFIGPAEVPDFGSLNPQAPVETLQFGQLAGLWSVTTHAYSGGSWYEGWPALWAFKYVLDGYAVQDLWYTSKENLAPPLAQLERDYLGTNLRVYDPGAGKWRISWSTNQGSDLQDRPQSISTAEQKHGVIVMRPMGQSGDTLRRVLFQNISDSTFTRVDEVSVNRGESWRPTLRLECRKLK